jgi:hypothetical protein
MNTYRISLKSGMTRYLFAEGHKTEGGEIVFFRGERPAEHFDNDEVLILDDLGKTPDYLTRLPYEVWSSIPFQ